MEYALDKVNVKLWPVTTTYASGLKPTSPKGDSPNPSTPKNIIYPFSCRLAL